MTCNTYISFQPHNVVMAWRDRLDPFNPKNIRGTLPKWCDFGLARYVAEASADDAEAPSVSIKGNEMYMAPEVSEKRRTGASWKTDVKAADVYSLGLVLSQLLTMKASEESSPADIVAEITAS